MTPIQLCTATLPFTRVDVYHNFKFEPSALNPGAEPDENNGEIFQTVTARPWSEDRTSPARFDTVIVCKDLAAEATGVAGKSKFTFLNQN